MRGGRRWSAVPVPPSAYLATFALLLLVFTPSSGHASAQGPPVVATPGRVATEVTALSKLQFVESGLPTKTSWEVVLAGPGGYFANLSTAGPGPMTFLLRSGNYSVSYTAGDGVYGAPSLLPYLDVAGNNSTLTVPFVPVFPVLFQEQGLPAGTAWEVVVHSTNLSVQVATANPNATVETIAGPFTFNVSSPGYTPTPASGVARQPAGKEFEIQFVPATTTVYYGIVEGIVNIGTLASVYVGGFPRTVYAGGSFDVVLPPGTYPVLVFAPGYTTYFVPVVLPANGSAAVAATLLPLDSNGSAANDTPGAPGLSYLDGVGMGAVIGAIVVAALWSARRWRILR